MAAPVAKVDGGDAAGQPLAPIASRRALVLNVTFEPISVVGARRAVVLVLGGTAVSVVDSDEAIRSEHICVSVPSVIRLTRMVHVPYRRRAPLSTRAVLARDDHTCQYCGARADSVDHVQPRSRGGEHTWENVVACCRACNARKGDRMLGDLRMRLQRRPTAPPAMSIVALSGRRVPEPWLDYLNPLDRL